MTMPRFTLELNDPNMTDAERRELAERIATALRTSGVFIARPVSHRKRRLHDSELFQAAVMLGLVALASGLAVLAFVVAGQMTGVGA